MNAPFGPKIDATKIEALKIDLARLGPMKDVLRLTRAGRLTEAVAAIKDGLNGLNPVRTRAGSPTDAGGPVEATSRLGTVQEPRAGREGGARAPARPRTSRFETRSVSNAAGQRNYKLYVPARFDDAPLPLIVMLHGCTQSPDDFAAGTRMNELADEMGYVVAYPEQSRSANMSGCWNWFNAVDQRRDGGEPSLIAAITREVMRDVSVAVGRVYVAGLSAGGAAAAIMGQRYPDLYAGVGVHSGLACGAARDMGSAFAAMRSGAAPTGARPQHVVPTIVFHGTADGTVNPANAGFVTDQARAGLSDPDVTTGRSEGGMAFTRKVFRDAAKRVAVEEWMLEGAGHAWAGGSAAGSYTDPRGPDASREMLRFFAGLATG